MQKTKVQRSLELAVAVWLDSAARTGRYWQYSAKEHAALRQRCEQLGYHFPDDFGYRIADRSISGSIHLTQVEDAIK